MPTMTHEEHEAESRRMRSAITRLRNKSKADHLTLAEKVEMHREIKVKQKELDDHLHNYFQLVPARTLTVDQLFVQVFGSPAV